jgi:hypothetical protein
MVTSWSTIILFSFIVFLSFANHPHENNRDEERKEFCYSSYQKDIVNQSREIHGKWERNQIYKNRGTFAYQPNPLEWVASACPVQARIFSCRRHDIEDRSKKRIRVDFGAPNQADSVNNGSDSVNNGSGSADRVEDKQHGYHSLYQVFHPLNCKLKTWSPETFLELLRNRRFAVAGDSVSMQFAIMLICSLHLHGFPDQPHINANYSLTWTDHSRIFGKGDCMHEDGKHCHLSDSSVYYPDYNVTIMYISDWTGPDGHGKAHPRSSLRAYYDGAGFTFEPPSSTSIASSSSVPVAATSSPSQPRDIMLLNIGLHLASLSEVNDMYQMVSEEYNQTKAYFLNINNPRIYSPPILIWRETSSQHFDTSKSHAPSGYYASSNRHVTTPCVPYENTTKAYLEDYRNRLADRWFNKDNNIPIMRIANVTGLAVDQHIGKQHRSDTANSMDCTHFCDESGVFYYWREVLYNILPVIING